VQDRPVDIDAMIAEEQRTFARESLGEAWADAASEGVDTVILAEAAIATALEKIVCDQGEDAARDLLTAMQEKLSNGAFDRDINYH
jgi:hypothetical protein